MYWLSCLTGKEGAARPGNIQKERDSAKEQAESGHREIGARPLPLCVVIGISPCQFPAGAV